MACSVWKVPCAPVTPWQMTRVSEPIRMDMEWFSKVAGKVRDGVGRAPICGS